MPSENDLDRMLVDTVTRDRVPSEIAEWDAVRRLVTHVHALVPEVRRLRSEVERLTVERDVARAGEAVGRAGLDSWRDAASAVANRANAVIAERDAALSRCKALEDALRELRERGTLSCNEVALGIPPCGDCARCRARALLTKEKAP